MIPRTLHQIWLDDPYPDEFARYTARWADLHPAWNRLMWNRSDALPELVNQAFFDRARQLVPKDWKRFQADLLRLELLWLYGGVYVDTDVEPLRPIDDLLEGVDCFVAWSPNRGARGERILTQAVMAATPQHPFIQECILRIPDAVQRYRGRPLAQMVGPWHVTRTYEDIVRTEPEPRVTVYPEHYFYPQSNADRDAGRPPSANAMRQAYGWHRWNTTLRKQGKGLG